MMGDKKLDKKFNGGKSMLPAPKKKKNPFGGDKTPPEGMPQSDMVPAEEAKYAKGGAVKNCRGMGAAIKGGRYFD